MAQNNIDKTAAFMNIDSNQYTLSLLQAGVNSGLIDESALVRIRTAIMQLGQETILKYTRGESTSVKTETAASILTSILYTIDACLLNLADHDQALQHLGSGDIKNIYQAGYDLINSCIEEAQALYHEVAHSKLQVEIYAYNTTIEEALPEFFALYDPVYNAHDTWANIDYPLLFNDISTQGIFYIRQYLENLQFENWLCSRFDPEDINILLNNFSRVYRLDYRETLINILEIVLTNSIFSVLSGGSALNLNISRSQFEFLDASIKELSPPLCLALINQAITTLCEELRIEDREIRNYVGKYASSLLPRLISARENDNLMNVIIVNFDNTQIPNIVWNEGRRLSDEEFRKIIDEILTCPDGAAKADIIHSEVNSLSDFIDLLEADCLFGSEFSDLFRILGDLELSMLIQIVYIEELRIGQAAPLSRIFEAKPLDIPWQQELASFLLGLDKARIETIENLLSLYTPGINKSKSSPEGSS